MITLLASATRPLICLLPKHPCLNQQESYIHYAVSYPCQELINIYPSFCWLEHTSRNSMTPIPPPRASPPLTRIPCNIAIGGLQNGYFLDAELGGLSDPLMQMRSKKWSQGRTLVRVVKRERCKAYCAVFDLRLIDVFFASQSPV